MEKLHKRAHDDLIMKDNSVSIHVRDLRFLMTEIFKTSNDENLPFMKFRKFSLWKNLGIT